MMTGVEYRKSLLDGRRVYLKGNLVEDLAEDPVLGDVVTRVAADYDRLYHDDDSANVLMAVPRSADDLREQVPMIHDMGMMAHVTYTSVMTMATAASRLGDVTPESVERIHACIDDARFRDIRITQCITDAKGDRGLPPGKQDDPDAYTRVVDHGPDGVVIRGAKLHITGASVGHELMVVPTKAMRPGEEDYAIACLIPVAADGVKIIDTTYAPDPDEAEDFPVSSRSYYPEGFVILDDVFVPTERILLDGLTAQAATFAHALGLWERVGGLATMVDRAEALTGLAQLIAEANGLTRINHVKDKITDMMIQTTLIRGSLEAAITHCHSGSDGVVFPDELYINAGKYHGAATYSDLVRNLHDIAGGSTATVPSLADLRNPDTGDLLRKYMATSKNIDGEYRMRLFHAIRDLTAGTYGGWKAVTTLQAGGGLYAQRSVTRKHFDLEHARQRALELIGMETSGGTG
jgi:4-hydroxybutyryl-CoA dehydratase/vinylacetyl-CoA-Delta-isomerase